MSERALAALLFVTLGILAMVGALELWRIMSL